MFLNNKTKGDIGPIVYEGLNFVLPQGVFWIWDKMGQHILDDIYQPHGEESPAGGVTLPPVVDAQESEWDGKITARVSRFEMSIKQVPAIADIMKIAKQRGVDAEYLNEVRDSQPPIDPEDVIEKINTLPIPDEVLYPADNVEPPSQEDGEKSD